MSQFPMDFAARAASADATTILVGRHTFVVTSFRASRDTGSGTFA